MFYFQQELLTFRQNILRNTLYMSQAKLTCVIAVFFKFHKNVTGYIYHTWSLTRISFRKYFESIIKAHLFHICFCYYALYLDLAEKQVYHFKVRCYFFMSAFLGRNIFYLPFNSLLSQIRRNELFFSAIDINNSF